MAGPAASRRGSGRRCPCRPPRHRRASGAARGRVAALRPARAGAVAVRGRAGEDTGARRRIVSWNLGDIFDTLGEAVPGDSAALLHGERAVSWTAFTRRTNNLAAALRARGGQPGDKVALYLRNRPEYLEATVACFKARLVHVNVNFRYLGDELRYIMDDADAKFVVFAGEFAERLDALRPRLPKVQV